MTTIEEIHNSMILIDQYIRNLKLGNNVDKDSLLSLINNTINNLTNLQISDNDYKNHILETLNNYKNYI